MNLAIYPGTFDPITNGHIDIAKRAVSFCKNIIISVVKNPIKNTFFPFEERIALVKESTKNIKGISVEGFDGLVVEFARKKEVNVIVRGLRMISDFEYEFQMALTNRSLAPKIETIFLMPHPEYSFISSRLIKEAVTLGADLHKFLPVSAAKALRRRLDENKSRINKR